MSLIVSAEGFKSMVRQLESLQDQLQQVQIHKNKIAVENGNVWHDNNDFEQSEIDERRLLREIADLKQKMKEATVIDEQIENFDIVNYGAKVEVSVNNGTAEKIFTVLFSDSDEESKYMKISANSPIGETIFHKEVGFIGNYTVEEKNFTIEILKIEY